MSKKITPMATEQAVAANLVSATLVTAASFWAMPVSTTHVTSGSIFGIGLLHRGEADWGRVGEILLSWAGTLPVAALLAAACYWLLAL
jgi:PiT family inorganic phosphate transporter